MQQDDPCCREELPVVQPEESLGRAGYEGLLEHSRPGCIHALQPQLGQSFRRAGLGSAWTMSADRGNGSAPLVQTVQASLVETNSGIANRAMGERHAETDHVARGSTLQNQRGFLGHQEGVQQQRHAGADQHSLQMP